MTNSSTFSEFAARLREFIRISSIAPFTEYSCRPFSYFALDLFELQFEHNPAYRRFCESRKINSTTIRDWRDVPAMPTAGFKEFELSSLATAERTNVFYSSGTTEQRPSRHFHSRESLSLYEVSLLAWFKANRVNGAEEHADFLMLTPAAESVPHSSLVHMFDTLTRELGSANSLFCGELQTDGAWGFDVEKIIGALRISESSGKQVALFGTAFNFVHLLDQLTANGLEFKLPVGSTVLETGGYKSRSRVLPKEELHALITERLGIPELHIICEYGMSEISSQAYDSAATRGHADGRVFHFPPWVRVQIVSPETGREVAEGETGLIRLFDLANVYSVMAIQTEDLGVRRGNGFELLGRAALAETRGCSLMSI